MSPQTAGSAAPRLVLHVGDGKTGSTSIQATLRRQPQALRNRGYLYLGTMLDLVPVRLFAWQSPGAVEDFLKLERAEADSQLRQVIRSVLAHARAEGLHTLIWSNEAFFGRAHNLYPALDWLRAEGVTLDIVAYVRRHDAWMRSAYTQWGIKHKLYTGPTRSFGEWYRSRQTKQFAPVLKRLEARYPGCVRVRNLDAVGDAVADFLALVGLADGGIEQVSRNEMPTTAELLLRVLVGNHVPGTARVHRYGELLGKDLVEEASAQAYLARFLPTEAELAEIRDQASADRSELDRILAANGQPPVDVSALPGKSVAVDESSLLLMLCDIVVRQALRIEALERRQDAGSITPPAPGGEPGDG